MTDTIDRLVRILDEEREAHRKAREERASAYASLMEEKTAVVVIRGEMRQALGDLSIAEAKIKEWVEYAALLAKALSPKKRNLVSKMPRYFARESQIQAESARKAEFLKKGVRPPT